MAHEVTFTYTDARQIGLQEIHRAVGDALTYTTVLAMRVKDLTFKAERDSHPDRAQVATVHRHLEVARASLEWALRNAWELDPAERLILSCEAEETLEAEAALAAADRFSGASDRAEDAATYVISREDDDTIDEIVTILGLR